MAKRVIKNQNSKIESNASTMDINYPLWEQLLEEDIQGIFDRRLGIDNDYYLNLNSADYETDTCLEQ